MRVIDLIRHNLWPLSLAITVGLVFSSVFLLNVARARVDPDFEYLPMKMVPGGPGDDFAHYSFVSKVLDGTVPVNDPYIFENSGRYTYYFLSRNGSYVLTALGGLVTGNVIHAYVFNQFFFPMLNFILLYLLAYRLTSHRLYSAATVVSIMLLYQYLWLIPPFVSVRNVISTFASGLVRGSVQYNEFVRSPNIMVSNVAVASVCLALHSMSKTARKWNTAFLGIALGISTYLYLPAGIVSGAATFFFLIANWGADQLRKKLVIATFIACIIHIPLLYAVAFQYDHARGFMVDLSEGVARAPWFLSLGSIVALVLTAIFIWKFSYREDRVFVRSLTLAFSFVYIVIDLIGGEFFAYRLAYRGFLPVWLLLIAVGLMPLARILTDAGLKWRIRAPDGGVADSRAEPSWISSCMKFGLTALILVCVGFGFLSQFATFLAYSDRFDDTRGVSDLTAWFKENAEQGSVVVSLDPDVLLLAPVYSHVYTYVPVRAVGVSSRDERIQRFYETLSNLGNSPLQLREFLARNMNANRVQDSARDPLTRERILLDLVLFFSQYADTDGRIPAAEIEEMVAGYRHFLLFPRDGFRWRADYLVVSSSQLSGSAAFKVDLASLVGRTLVARLGEFLVYRV